MGHGFDVNEAPTFEAAAHELRTAPPDVAIVSNDLAVPGDRELAATLRNIDERIPLIIVVDGARGFSTRATEGVDFFFSSRPPRETELTQLLLVVQRLVEATRTRRRSLAINILEHRRGIDPFVGESPAIKELAEQAHQVLNSHAPVLIQGETGTGKGVLASWLHHHGPRAEEAFVDINCAGLSREFLESELFGHERGAFTGASAAKLGLLEVAHRGTAFLDEIGEIDLQLQPRLLKVLEEKRFRRLGDVRAHVVDIRLIAATNRDLAKRSREGTFRADLFYRINTIALTTPALRRRREDIALLARLIANGLGHDIDFTPDAVRAMQVYDWPGNIRELRNVIERAILISNRAARITTSDLRFEIGGEAPPTTEDNEALGTLLNAERKHIERVLRYEKGSVERTATRLGVSRSTLYQKLRRFGIAKSSS